MQETRSTICPNDILIWKSIMNLSASVKVSLQMPLNLYVRVPISLSPFDFCSGESEGLFLWLGASGLEVFIGDFVVN